MTAEPRTRARTRAYNFTHRNSSPDLHVYPSGGSPCRRIAAAQDAPRTGGCGARPVESPRLTGRAHLREESL